MTKILQFELWISQIDLFKIHKNQNKKPSANKINFIKNINHLILTLLSLVIVCHIMACVWIFIANISVQYQVDGPNTTNWILNSPIHSQYNNL